ncbi:MAG: beta-ketoacyl-[acyl-carrier-protein] synthase II [Gemmataceae bacterium]
MRRVVITGMGVVSPLGDQVETLYRSQIAGKSGVGLISHFDASTFPTRIGAEVRDFDLARYVAQSDLWATSCDASKFAAAATQMALDQAGLLGPGVDRSRFGVYLGAGEATHEVPFFMEVVGRTYQPELRSADVPEMIRLCHQRYTAGGQHDQELHTSTGYLADYFDLQGPNYSCLTACAAGTQAIGEAVELIRREETDLMVAGGAHSMIYPTGVTGFNLLTALSTRNEQPQKASRPFDLRRDGFVLGEGAGIVILEELEHARRRGATIYAEMTGYGSTADAFRVTDSHPEGRGAIACVRAALRDARLSPDQIGYINAHGTSTRLNDYVETLTIKKVFGDDAYRVPMSSTKSMLGHLIGAAGAVELIISVMALRHGVLPPTINYETRDPDCDLDYIPNVARERRVRHVMSQSFGFGGQNAALIASRFDG